MRLRNIEEVEAFFATVNSCKGEVWLESPAGDTYNLKSKFSTCLALGELLGTHGDELELFCSLSEDEAKFYKFFHENPEVMK